MISKWLTGLLTVILAGWLTYLAILTQQPDPEFVSRSQFMVADLWVVAQIDADRQGNPLPKIILQSTHAITPSPLPQPGEGVIVLNLADTIGFTQPGMYALILNRDAETYRIPTPPEMNSLEKPRIYPWTPEIEQQFQQLQAATPKP
ncbi:hypothetical protein [Tuwongella immobilis]|uniref:Uncharacterized protein n=1 Tax=Tuwongella immobilis TaxID=692036 RepID=A0A6C2YME8_9BACT|nr:hypothetical protein [Tuwongella immobilis]VIP02491.1 unnamed protein product [Tuwongella immobilis]VTS01560.1 unnamed protein product [Tuwongella immobilis]